MYICTAASHDGVMVSVRGLVFMVMVLVFYGLWLRSGEKQSGKRASAEGFVIVNGKTA